MDLYRSEARQIPQVKVTEISQIPPGTGKAVQAGAKLVAIFNVGGTFYAFDSLCTHRHGPLAEGALEGTIVTCPWHGSKFDVTSGQAVKGSCEPARLSLSG